MGLKRRLFVLLASASLVGALFPAAASAAGPTIPSSYPRNQTLYTSGTMYGPPGDFNPIKDWDYTTGAFGLLYESLFLYNPLSDKFIPWLAQSGSWTGPKEYTLKLRAGLTWSDGQPITADDVIYTVNLGQALLGPLQHAVELPPERDEGRQPHREVHLLQGRVPGVVELPLQPGDRAAAHLDRPVRDGRDGQQPEPGGLGPVPAPDLRPDQGRLGQERQLVGQDPAGPGRQADVHHRPGQRQQQRVARPDARGPDRPEQQLPARHQQHRQRHRRLRHPDLLREAAVHAVRQHGLARDE